MTTMLTQPTPGARLSLDPAGLHISALTIADTDFLTGLRHHLDRHDAGEEAFDPVVALGYLTTTLSVGARALSVVGTSLDTATLERSVADLTTTVDTSTRQAVEQLAQAITAATDADHGTIPRAVQASLTTLAVEVAALVAGDDAPVRATVTEAVRAVTAQALAEIQRAVGAQADAVRRVLAADSPGSPLFDLKHGLVTGLNESHRRLSGQLAELRTALEIDKATTAATATATAASPRHGLESEAATLAALEELAHTAGDQLEPTGTTPGLEPRCLKGDGVITLTPPPGHHTATARVVIEVKDRERAQSVSAWRQLLEDARRNRGALAALGIVKSTSQMPGQRRLHALDASTYLLAYDPSVDAPDLLTAVYHLLRAQAWHTALADGRPGDGVDLGRLKTAITDLAGALDGFDALTRHSGAARRSLDQLDKAAGALRADIRGRVEATLDCLTPDSRAGGCATAAA